MNLFGSNEMKVKIVKIKKKDEWFIGVDRRGVNRCRSRLAFG